LDQAARPDYLTETTDKPQHVGRNKRSALRRSHGMLRDVTTKAAGLVASVKGNLSLSACRIIVALSYRGDAGSSPSISWTGDAAF
jgi:hypothetical protein